MNPLEHFEETSEQFWNDNSTNGWSPILLKDTIFVDGEWYWAAAEIYPSPSAFHRRDWHHRWWVEINCRRKGDVFWTHWIELDFGTLTLRRAIHKARDAFDKLYEEIKKEKETT